MRCRSLVGNLTKLRPPSVEVWSKFRPNFDTPSVEVWSKFGRSLVEVWCGSLVDILSTVLCISLMYRANFDQTSTLGVSKFGRSLVEVSTLGVSKFGRKFDQTSTPSVEVWSN